MTTLIFWPFNLRTAVAFIHFLPIRRSISVPLISARHSGGLMLAAFVCRPVFFRLTHATRGFPGNASGAVGELRAIACANARAGAAGGNAAAAAGRFAQRSSGLLAPFRRHLRVVPPVAAAWKKTRTGGFVRVENITGNVTARSTGSGGGVPRGTGTSPSTRKQNQKPVRNVQAKVSKTEMGKRASVHSWETEKGLKTKGVGSRAYIQVLGLGVDVNDTSASVLLFTDTQRILFNVGEGFQRFAVENGINIRKLNRIVLTQVNSRTTGGLTGMLLTMADGATEHRDDEPTLVIHGPPRTERLMGTFAFCFLFFFFDGITRLPPGPTPRKKTLVKNVPPMNASFTALSSHPRG